MERASVVLFEDSKTWCQLAKMAVEVVANNGHAMVAEARSAEAAHELCDQIARGDTKADVALVDGRLSDDVPLGSDARWIISRLRQDSPGTFIIGFSSLPMSIYDIEVDYDDAKSTHAVTVLADLIDNL